MRKLQSHAFDAHDLHLIKLYAVLPQKRFDYRHVHALAYVQKRHIGDFFHSRSDRYFMVFEVEAKV